VTPFLRAVDAAAVEHVAEGLEVNAHAPSIHRSHHLAVLQPRGDPHRAHRLRHVVGGEQAALARAQQQERVVEVLLVSSA
jgi:hypothetical protein